MVKSEELAQLRCEITVLPQRHYNHAARAVTLAESLLKERDNVIAFAKELLLEMHLPEKEALAQIFRHLHGAPAGHSAPKQPW